ncbi:MAG: FkbM family methyltransferase [Waddliaceae bacterium]
MARSEFKKTWSPILALKGILSIKNWYVILLDYCGLLRGSEITYIFRNGIKCITRGNNKDDRAVIKTVWLNKVYILNEDDLQDGSIVIDIGAQIGVFSVFSASYANNIKVYAYEPFPDNYKLLIENIEVNKLEKHVYPFDVAVTDSSEKIKLFIDERGTTGHSVIIPQEKHVTVNSTTLTDIMEANKISQCDLLKMDIEGAEYPVLYSTPNHIFRKIKRIYLEYEDIDGSTKYNHQYLHKFLSENGFSIIEKEHFLYATRID